MSRDPIEITRYSTESLPPEERYPAWLKRNWPRADRLFRTHPREPFNTVFDSAMLGDIILTYTVITAMRYERLTQVIRTSDFDPIVVNLMVSGLAEGTAGERRFRQPAGTALVYDFAKPADHESSASVTHTIIVPRPIASVAFGALDDLHGMVIGGPAAALLFAHAKQTWAALPSLQVNTAAALGRTLLELLGIALLQVRPALAPVTPDTALRRRAEAEIVCQLNKPITVAGLCEALEVTRTRLFAAFRAEGGVLARVAAIRLDNARAALADLERAEPIGMIAERMGFSEASHLSRSFRQRYGMTPREYRRIVAQERAAGV